MAGALHCLPPPQLAACRPVECMPMPSSQPLLPPPAPLLPAGFPVRFELMNTVGFEALSAQGIAGSDLECPEQTAVPGKCALSSVADAMALCTGLPACEAVVHYRNGAWHLSAAARVLWSGAAAALSQRGAVAVLCQWTAVWGSCGVHC